MELMILKEYRFVEEPHHFLFGQVSFGVELVNDAIYKQNQSKFLKIKTVRILLSNSFIIHYVKRRKLICEKRSRTCDRLRWLKTVLLVFHTSYYPMAISL